MGCKEPNLSGYLAKGRGMWQAFVLTAMNQVLSLPVKEFYVILFDTVKIRSNFTTAVVHVEQILPFLVGHDPRFIYGGHTLQLSAVITSFSVSNLFVRQSTHFMYPYTAQRKLSFLSANQNKSLR